MSSLGVIESALYKLQSLATDSPVNRYSPSLDQIGHYLIRTPGTAIDENIILSLEYIISNLHISLLENYSENMVESQVGETRYLASELCKVLRSGHRPDRYFYDGLVKIGKNLRNIDAQLKRVNTS